MEEFMAMRDHKTDDRFSGQTISVAPAASELTHREDYARNGDYLGRQPGDVSGRNHFDVAVQDVKMGDRINYRPPVVNAAPAASEMTHSEDYACNGDYLGRQQSDVSGHNHFDEEYFVDESENENDAEMPVESESAKCH
jgi:hypothetical protein